MKIEELKKYIQKLGPEIYSFTYVLVPDDLQTSQLMIDCVQSFLIQKKASIDKMIFSKNLSKDFYKDKQNAYLLDAAKWHLFKIIFHLSKKRYQQLRISFKNVENNGGFFALGFDEKAVLYLKDKAIFSLDEIEFITDLTKSEILSHLYIARMKMTEIMPANLGQEQVISG